MELIFDNLRMMKKIKIKKKKSVYMKTSIFLEKTKQVLYSCYNITHMRTHFSLVYTGCLTIIEIKQQSLRSFLLSLFFFRLLLENSWNFDIIN